MTNFWGALMFGCSLILVGCGLVVGFHDYYDILSVIAFLFSGLSLFCGIVFWGE